MDIIAREEGPRPAGCPRCAGEAEWRFVDDERTVVEILCPDCGRFRMPRAEFDQAASDIVEDNGRE